MKKIENCENQALRDRTDFVLQSKYNDNIYTYVYTKSSECTSSFILQNSKPILGIMELENQGIGDIEFAKEFHKKVIEQYNEQRKQQFPIDFVYSGIEFTESLLKD